MEFDIKKKFLISLNTEAIASLLYFFQFEKKSNIIENNN